MAPAEKLPQAESVCSAELSRVHERLDDVLFEIQKIASSQAEITSSCGPCKAKVASLDSIVNGNGLPGMKQRIAVLETGKVDTFSIRSFGVILAAVGAFVGTLAAAIGGLVAAVASRGPVAP